MKTTLVATTIVLLTAHVSHAVVVDQFSPAVGNGGDFGLYSNYMAQTFIPGLDGTLDHITLTLEGSGIGGVGNYYVDLVSTNGGLPTTSVIATAIVPAPIPVSVVAQYDFDFSGSMPLLLAGTQYAWVLHGDNSESANTYGSNRPSDFYPNGTAYKSDDQGATYLIHHNAADFAFTTYMEPIPEPTTWTLALAALCFVVVRRRS